MATVALVVSAVPATAATVLTDAGTDPSAAGATVAWQLPGGGNGVIVRSGQAAQALPGADPAVGPDNVVWRAGETLVVADQATLRERLRVVAPGAEEPAVSARWLVWRARTSGGDVLRALDMHAPGEPAVDLRHTRAPGRLGRPSLEGDRAVYHRAGRSESTIEEIFLPTRRRTTLRRGRHGTQLLNPSQQGGQLLYVSASSTRQIVLIGPRRARRGNADRRLLSMHPTVRRDAGYERGRRRHGQGYPGGRPPPAPPRAPAGLRITLWSTALAADAAYVSRLRMTAAGTSAAILRLVR